MAEVLRNVPRAIGRYEVLGHIDVGGMAEILLGRLSGPSGFERVVVIKRILPYLARTGRFVDMFLDEARIVAGIRHPNVVQVHELGREQDDLFLVMEYVEGESLGSLVRRLWTRDENLGYVLASHVIAEVCAGLHAAHELTDADGKKQQIVHRDISPQNIMITYGGQVKLLDFGIAKAADRMARTEAGQIKGKFAYMSPEQCKGKALDRRSDIFSLGILLYELTVNRRLFRRSNELLTLKAICDHPLMRPSAVVPGYPAALEAICLRALARAPERRYPTAADMRRELVVATHALGAVGVHEEALASLMQRLFADRIEDKSEMLRRVRIGSTLTRIPDAEVDAGTEIPILCEDPATEVSSASDIRPPAVTPPRSRSGARVGIALLAVAGLAAGSVVALTHRPVIVGATPAQVSSAPAVAEASSTASATEVAPSKESITLKFESNPPGAQVWIGGEHRGVTPTELQVPRGSDMLDVELRREGFMPRRERVAADANQHFSWDLHPAAPARAPRRPDRTAPAPSASRAHPDFYPFE